MISSINMVVSALLCSLACMSWHWLPTCMCTALCMYIMYQSISLLVLLVSSIQWQLPKTRNLTCTHLKHFKLCLCVGMPTNHHKHNMLNVNWLHQKNASCTMPSTCYSNQSSSECTSKQVWQPMPRQWIQLWIWMLKICIILQQVTP